MSDAALAEKTGIHVKSLHQMFGPKGNPTAANLFNIIACLQEHEGVRLQGGGVSEFRTFALRFSWAGTDADRRRGWA